MTISSGVSYDTLPEYDITALLDFDGQKAPLPTQNTNTELLQILQTVLAKMESLGTKLENIDDVVSQGIRKYFGKKPSAKARFLIKEVQEETEAIELFADQLKSAFSDKGIIEKMVSNRNFHGERCISCLPPTFTDGEKLTGKEIHQSIIPRYHAHLNNEEEVALTVFSLADYEKIYQRTYSLSKKFVKAQILPGKYNENFSWKQLDGKSQTVYKLMLEHFLFECDKKVGGNYVIPFHTCINSWAATQTLIKIITTSIRSHFRPSRIKRNKNEQVKDMNEDDKRLYMEAVDYRDELTSRPVVNIDFSQLPEDLIYSNEKESDENSQSCTASEQMFIPEDEDYETFLDKEEQRISETPDSRETVESNNKTQSFAPVKRKKEPVPRETRSASLNRNRTTRSTTFTHMNKKKKTV